MRYLIFYLCLTGFCVAMSSRKPLKEKAVTSISKTIKVEAGAIQNNQKKNTLVPDAKKTPKEKTNKVKAPPILKKKIGDGTKRIKPRFT